ncbi:MAG: heavy-metal-associated domain-containing protein [Marinifilaceae bacterium]|nr:heavy-metal-associated domain-containing protein [Marinifilaceae bacterium]
MKNFTKTLLICLMSIFTICFFTQENFAKKHKKTKTVVFKVEMDCHTCAKKIKDNIPFEKGVRNLIVNFKAKEVTVTYKLKSTNVKTLVVAFKKLGFKAVPKRPNRA